MKEKIRILIPKKSEYISVVRMSAASIANTLKLNIDEIDDLKIIVSEISVFFMNAVKENTNNFELDFIIEDDKFTIEFIDLNEGEIIEQEDDLCLMIIESLADEFYLEKENKKAVVTKKL